MRTSTSPPNPNARTRDDEKISLTSIAAVISTPPSPSSSRVRSATSHLLARQNAGGFRKGRRRYTASPPGQGMSTQDNRITQSDVLFGSVTRLSFDRLEKSLAAHLVPGWCSSCLGRGWWEMLPGPWKGSLYLRYTAVPG